MSGYADIGATDSPERGDAAEDRDTRGTTDVRIEHSSGTDDIDLPCQRAAYTCGGLSCRSDPKTGPEIIEFTIYF